MKTNEMLDWMADKDFLDKIYQFSYHRCSTCHEAEDLCSDIVLAVMSSALKQESIENFYAFTWAVARRVYADFCEKRRKEHQTVSIENSELPLAAQDNEIDRAVEAVTAAAHQKKIFAEIAFLSKAYRDVMVMYYLEERKIKDIASRLGISETTVKQRLFSARNTVRKEVKAMNQRSYSLQPVHLIFLGTGNPSGNDPSPKAERMLSQNLIYLCKEKPKSAKELSEELCVPMPYIEEELDIQCRGENGQYGTLRKLDSGKYALNILVVDYQEYDQANQIIDQHLTEIVRLFKQSAEEHKDAILNFPYLSPQTDVRFLLWSILHRAIWNFTSTVNAILQNEYFAGVTPPNRPYHSVAIAHRASEAKNLQLEFYGNDGIDATMVGGYRHVFVSNLYGNRMDRHFDCGHNLSHDPQLLMVLKAIGGLSIDALTDDEKETAAKCIECGILRKRGDLLEPNIIVIERQNNTAFCSLSNRLCDHMQEVEERIAEELADFIKQHVPTHLINEYQLYTQLIAGERIVSSVIEQCIEDGLLSEPKNRLCAEGMLMMVEK